MSLGVKRDYDEGEEELGDDRSEEEVLEGDEDDDGDSYE